MSVIRLGTLGRYRDILWYRTLAQLKAESNNNYLGYIWFILEPLISTAILYVVFGMIMGNRGSDVVLFILIGMMIWQWFESSLMTGVNGIREKIGILQTIRISKFIFPVVSVLANTWKFLWVFGVLLVLSNVLGFGINPNYLWLPLVILVELLFIIGLTVPLAILVTYMPDFVNLISSILRLLFFLSGIFFSVDRVPPELRDAFLANPVALLMNAFRDIILDGRAPDFANLAYCALWGLISLGLGLLWSRRVDQRIIKSIST